MKPAILHMRSVGKRAGTLVHIFHQPDAYWFYPITNKRKTLIWGKGLLRYGRWMSVTRVSEGPDHPLYQTHFFPRSEEGEHPLGWLVIPKPSRSINAEGYTTKPIPLSECMYFTLRHAETLYYLDFPQKEEVPKPRENFFHPGYRYRYRQG